MALTFCLFRLRNAENNFLKLVQRTEINVEFVALRPLGKPQDITINTYLLLKYSLQFILTFSPFISGIFIVKFKLLPSITFYLRSTPPVDGSQTMFAHHQTAL